MVDVLIIVVPLLLLGGAFVWLLARRSAAPPAETRRAGISAPPPASPAGGAAAKPAPVRKQKSGPCGRDILIVDDQPAIRMLLAEVFQTAGFNVREAGSGKEAIERFALEPAAFLLLDLKMPDMDGLEALREIRSMSRDVKAIMISAYSDPEKLEEARRLGVQRVFTKPFDIEKLRDYVVRQLES